MFRQYNFLEQLKKGDHSVKMTTTTHTLGPTQQLVDLNEDLTNFDMKFTAKSPNGAPFDGAVVSQAVINSGASFDYKHCPDGTFGANIVADKGVYQNFFLALKADHPCQCVVTVDKKEIPAKFRQAPISSSPPPIQQRKVANENVNWKLILFFAIIIGGCGMAYYYYYNKKKVTVESIPDVPKLVSNEPLSLLDRLNNLPIS